MPVKVPVDAERLAEFCRRRGICRLAFFGSVLRDDFRSDSDVDVLYEFSPGREPGWEIGDIEAELSSLLSRRADMVPFRFLNPRIRERILAEAEVQYAA